MPGTSATDMPSELEIDECISGTLCNDDGESHQCPHDGNRGGWRARDDRLERAPAHQPVHDHDAADDETDRDEVICGQYRLRRSIESEHSAQHLPGLAEVLG